MLRLAAKLLLPCVLARTAGILVRTPVEVNLGDMTGRFPVVGDWGCGSDPRACPDNGSGQRAVAQAMGAHAATYPVDFVLNTGDSFYPMGIADHHDPKWNSTFEDVYVADGLQVPWYGVLGNHDWHRNASGLVMNRGRWRLPAVFYTAAGHVAGIPVTFFFLDTNVVMSTEICNQRSRANWGHLSTCESEIVDVFHRQLGWLEERLQRAAGTLRVVVGHHPLHATGKWAWYGDNAPRALAEHLAPLLRRHGVHTYLGGHDHLLQHLAADGTDFYVVGAGGGELEDRPHEVPTNASVLHTSAGVFGFAVLEIGANDVCVSFHAVNGSHAGNARYRHCRPHGLSPSGPPSDGPALGAIVWEASAVLLAAAAALAGLVWLRTAARPANRAAVPARRLATTDPTFRDPLCGGTELGPAAA